MTNSFENDPYPGKPKILFVGLAQSTHTHAWIDLLCESEFNVRLFAIENGLPASDWPVKTYASYTYSKSNPVCRRNRHTRMVGAVLKLYNKFASKYKLIAVDPADVWLAVLIKRWKPDIIHTLGFFDEQGGQFYHEVRRKFHLEIYGKWVLQLRGGSDMALRRHNPEFAETIQQALSECDQILCDNQANIRFAGEMGISADKFAPIAPVPGTGGIDLTGQDLDEVSLPSRRERIILWPKAYEAQWSKALPVLEAIRSAWERIQPCEIYMLATSTDVYEWFLALPQQIRKHCHVNERIPRQEVLSLMKRARILLAPSLIDGIPNSLYEAMALGAFPIVSPLETILSAVSEPENVLFARNLYPEEIARALVRAMRDDALIDQAAGNNVTLVRRIANRLTIKSKVIDFYQGLARETNRSV